MSNEDYSVEDLPDDKLSAVSDAAFALHAAQAEVVAIELQLSAAKARVQQIEQSDLPQAMLAMGMEKFTLTNGDTVKIVDVVNASITEENQPLAFAWLRRTGNDSIIKRLVGAAFGKGDDKKAASLRKIIEEKYEDTEIVDKATIHSATLKSFVTERLLIEAEVEKTERETGTKVIKPKGWELLPQSVFGVYTFKKAVVKTPKAKG